MKTLTVMLLALLSMNAFSAGIMECQIDGIKYKNVVVLNPAATESIQKILDTEKSTEEKRDSIKKIIYIETLSVGNGYSVCELAIGLYNVSEEKCMKVMKSRDVMSAILDNSTDIDATLACKIGITAKLQMQFNM